MAGEQQLPIRVPLEDVPSSNLSAIGYDEMRQIVAVKFKSGLIINYGSVPPAVARDFATALSFGQFYARHIRNRYPAEAVTGRCPKCGAQNADYIGDTCSDCGCAVVERFERPARAARR